MEDVRSLEDLVPGLRTATFGWTENVRRCLVHLLVTDSEFFSMHKETLKPEFFPDHVHSAIFAIAKAYHDEYHTLPGQPIAHNELKRLWAEKPEDWAVAETEFYACYEYHEGIAVKDYIHDKLTKFCRFEAYKQALVDAYQMLMESDEDFDMESQVDTIFRQALMVGTQEVDVIDYFDDFESRYEEKMRARERNTIDKIPTAFPSIDRELLGGLGRKEIGIFLGDSGTGKSFLLNHVAVHNAMVGYKVLYVTLENSAEVVQDRLDSTFTQIKTRNLLAEADTRTLVKLRHLRESYNHNLRIMEFEEGSMSIAQIRGITERMSIREGWIPDVVVLDYIDELADYPGVNDYEGHGRNVRAFRGWMKHINAAGFTATQANRASADAEVVGRKNIGDSYKKLRRADYMWSINVTPEEDVRGLCRLFFVKNRNGKQEYMIYLERDLSRAHFKEIGRDEHEKRLMQPLPGETDKAKGGTKTR